MSDTITWSVVVAWTPRGCIEAAYPYAGILDQWSLRGHSNMRRERGA